MLLRGGVPLIGAKIMKGFSKNSGTPVSTRRGLIMGAIAGLAVYLTIVKPGLSPDELFAYFKSHEFARNSAFEPLRGRLIKYTQIS